MSKKKILVKGPALSLSGYGEQARFLLRSLRDRQDKFDIYVQNIPWGRTGAIPRSEESDWIEFLKIKNDNFVQAKGVHDIAVQVTIPNEFEKLAPVNIGYTAGIETTKVSPQWIDRARMMDKMIVVSEHSKDVYNNTEYKLQNQQNGEIVSFMNTTPIDVVHFPARAATPVELPIDFETDFNFLSVVQWGPRKNLEMTVVSFLKEFANDSDVGLVLKINIAKNNTADKLACEARLKNIRDNFPGSKCKIYLIHGNMTDQEVAGLYTHPKINALVSTTHGEGFGLPIFEAVCAGLPVIAPKWSGHVDFLTMPVTDGNKTKKKNHFIPVEFDLSIVGKEAVWDTVIQADSQWCFPKEYSVMDAMRRVRKNPSESLSLAKKLKPYVLDKFSEEKQKEKMLAVFEQYAPDLHDDSDIEPEDVQEY